MDMGCCPQGYRHRRFHTPGISDNSCGGFQLSFLTLQVLLDALVHGFVHINQLALLVFDEGATVLASLVSVHPSLIWLPLAHSCTGNHPSSRILRNFYHASPAEARPSILGLSASPVVNGKIGNLG